MSVYRRALLERLGIPFDCRPPGVDETPRPGESGTSLVDRLARAKAAAVATQHPGAVVIGSDQIAILDEETPTPRILGKPGSVDACCEQLSACSGKTLSFVTAVAVMRHGETPAREWRDVTKVRFRNLDSATVRRYVEHESPLDCAGGFKSEGLGITLCERIDAIDPTALIGLPLIRLSEVLRHYGFALP